MNPLLARPRLVVGVGVLVVMLAAVLAPWAPALYVPFQWVCHQQPERCLRVGGLPLAVCARCLGFYAGLLLACVVPLRLPRMVLAALLALQIVDAFLDVLSNWPRLLMAAALGWLAWSEVCKLAAAQNRAGH